MSDDARLGRWRLVLGGGEADGLGVGLSGREAGIDAALSLLYDAEADVDGPGRQGGPQRARDGSLGRSAPRVARWLGDIREYFPSSLVRVLQGDAIERLGIEQLLLEPELLEAVEPDVSLVETLIALNRVIPDRSRATARLVVRRVVDALERRLADGTRRSVTGALSRAARTRRPRPRDIDWDRTIRANLRHYQPERGTLIPETLVGHGRRDRSLRRSVILCVDQSGSMATSVVYASVFAAVLASLPSLDTRLVVFDTAVVDLTPQLADPVDVLFATQLGGGTDIAQALAYSRTLISRPADTILVLVSDLFEGGDREGFLRRCAEIVASGTQLIALLALADDGAPAYDHVNAAALAALGVPAFARTPDRFPDLMAAAIERRSVAEWAASQGVAVSRPG